VELFKLYAREFFHSAALTTEKQWKKKGGQDSFSRRIGIIGLTLGGGKTGEKIDVFINANRLKYML
jgi:hypothetical protein